MEQKNYYEKRVVKNSKKNIASGYVQGRNQFVIDWIKKDIEFNDKLFERKPKIAELSIGNGDLSLSLLKSLSSIDLTCLEIASSSIDLVREKTKYLIDSNHKHISFIECNFDQDFEKISDKSFEIVIALDIIEHCFDVFGFIANCQRVLKNNGILILRVPNIAYIKHRFGLLFGYLPVTSSWHTTKRNLTAWKKVYGWDSGHLHYFTIPMLYNLLQEYSFSIESCRDPGTKFSILRDFFPSLLYSNPLIIARKT